MDNSEEELFDAIPSTSTSYASSEWIVEKNTSIQNIFKTEKDASSDVSLSKNISIKLTRLGRIKTKRKRNVMQLKNKNKKSRVRRWKNGNCSRKKKKSQKLQFQKELEKTVPIAELTLESLKNIVSDDAYTHLHEEIPNAAKQLDTCASENTQSIQNDNRGFTLSIHEMRDEEENLYDDKTSKYAHVLPYKFYQRRKQISNTVDKVMHSDILSLSNNEAAEQDTHNDKSEHNQSPTETQEIKITKDSQSLDIEDYCLQKQLILKKKISALGRRRGRKRRKISSSSSNSSILAIENNMETNDNSIQLHSFHEDRDRKILPNMQFSRELQVNLTKLEEISDANVIKWRKNKEQNTSEGFILETETKRNTQEAIIRSNEEVPTYEKSPHVKKGSKDHLATKRRSFITSLEQNQLILKEVQWNELFSSENSKKQTNVCENSSRLLVAPDTISAKKLFPSNKLHNLLDKKLEKKYKLFKKPKVLLIKLECLKDFKDDKYSAAEINHLTKKYISNVIKSTCLPIVQAENLNFSTSSDINRNYEQLGTEENLKDAEITENNSDENAPFKMRRNKHAFMSQDKSLETLKNKNLQQQTLLQVWQNAFCRKLEKPQKVIVKQSNATQSKISSVSQSSPKKSADTIHKSSFASFMSSKNKEMPIIHTISEKFPETKVISTKCSETSSNENISDYANLSANANIEKVVSKSIVPQSSDSVISESSSKNIADTIAISDSSSNLSSEETQKSQRFGFYIEREALNKTLSKTLEKNNLKSSKNDKTSVKSKASEMCNQSPCEKAQVLYKCIICTMLFENDQLLQVHLAKNSCKIKNSCALTNSIPSNTAECVISSQIKKATDSQISFANKTHSLEDPKLSASQQYSVNKKGDLQKFVQSLNDSSGSFLLSSITNDETLCRRFWTLQSKGKSKSLIRSCSSADFDSQNQVNIFKSKLFEDFIQPNHANKIICKICSQIFESQSELCKHMLCHTIEEFRKIYLPKYKKISNNNDQVSKDAAKNSTKVERNTKKSINVIENSTVEQAKALLDNTNAEDYSIFELEISERDIEKRNNMQNFFESECTVKNTEIQSAENNKTIQCKEKNNVLDTVAFPENPDVSVKPQSSKCIYTICKCHNVKTVYEDTIFIEIVVLCDICHILYRRFECFEAHFQHYTKDSTCVKNRKRGRLVKLLCTVCFEVVDNVESILCHLKTHIQSNKKIVGGFRCNICKVIFYGSGHMFKHHFYHHMKNPFFLVSRSTFPHISYIGSTLIKMPTTNNENLLDVYMQVTDYSCRKCKQVFTTEEALQLHDTNCQNNAVTVAVTTNVDDVESLYSTTSGKSVSSSSTSEKMQILLICGFCNKTFYNKASFELHSLEHKEKRHLHPHYMCVSVTPITKIYICRICTIVCQTLKKFEEHWLTHGILQEDYVCSHCQNHYDTFDLFKQHVIIHRNANEKQQGPMSCEVIYRDISDQRSKTSSNSQEHVIRDDLSQTNLHLEKREKEHTNDKSHNDLKVSSIADSQQLTRIISPDLLANKNIQNVEKDVNNVPEETFSTTTQSKEALINNKMIYTTSLKNKTSESIEKDIEESEEEGHLVIEISENEEDSLSNEISRKIDNVQKSATIPDSAIVVDKERCLNNIPFSISTKTSNDANPSSNIKTNIISKESMIELDTKMMQSKSLSKNDNDDTYISENATNISKKTTTTTTETKCANEKSNINNLTNSSVNISVNQSKTSLPKNIMNSISKSFLRVKSLAELMDVSTEQYRCKNNQTSSANNSQKSQSKPQFNPSMHVSTAIQNQSQSPVTVSPLRSPSNQVIDTMNSKQSQIIDVKQLNNCNNKTANKAAKVREIPQMINKDHRVTWLPSLNNSIVQPQLQSQQIYQLQQIRQQKLSRQQTYVTQSDKVQSVYQQQPHLFVTATLQQMQQFQQQQQTHISRAQQQHQRVQHLQQQQEQQQQQQQQQKQQLKQQKQQEREQQQQKQQERKQQQMQRQQMQQPRLQQQQVQQPRLQLHQVQQQQQLQLQQMQQQQQNVNSITVTPLQSNIYQATVMPLPMYMQQQQQQQPIDVGNKFVLNYALSKECVPYQSATDNVIPTNSVNNIIPITMNTTMQQISQKPERYICICCPGFECNSIQEFTVHERSPKHEARSRYNGISYAPR